MLQIGLFVGCKKSAITLADLSCEHLTNPLGIDETEPGLSWKLVSDERGQKQTAYQVLVASSLEKLNENEGDFWDSGKVSSDQSVYVTYNGQPLESRMRCYWKVRIWDKDGRRSNWSEPAKWSMGLLQADDWKGQWIGTPEEDTAPYYRQSFNIDKTSEIATIYLTPLGYFELFINGEKVGDEVLAPAVSNYSKRTYYRTYDVSSYLKPGKNSIGIWMGSGWYTPGYPGVIHHSPVVRAQLELSGKGIQETIITDTSWLTKPSDRERLGEWRGARFGGERVDARKLDPYWWHEDRSAGGWIAAVEAEVADVPCTAQTCKGNVVFKVIKPQTVEILDEETILVDFGTNLTGLMQIDFHNLEAGTKVSMYYADLDMRREEDRWRIRWPRLRRKNFATYDQWDEFISAGNGKETFENVFNYHGFKYVLIEGLPYLPALDDMAALAVETEVRETATFSCSNDLYNRIHNMVRWTYRCLNLGGQTVDCPHRERLGYGDGQTIMDMGLYNFDALHIYEKWSRNWWDEQQEDGFVPFTAPTPHRTGGGPAWGAMCVMVPWKSYQFSSNLRLLEEGYPVMKKYLEYLGSHSVDGILQDIFPGERWPNLGDWVPPGRGMDQRDWVDDSSRRFFNNCYRIYLLQIMQEVAGLLGREDDVLAFQQEMEFAQKGVHQAWFNPEDNNYANGEQPYLIFPLKIGVTPDHLREAVFEKYVETLLVEDGGHLNTGMIGTQLMTDYLIEKERHDLIDTYVNKKTYPGWGFMVESGATTAWEQWNGYFSQIHSCFLHIGSWFYSGLAGIRIDPETPGFKHIIFRPGLVESVDWVQCSHISQYGEIVSNWKIRDNTFLWDVRVPPNTVATIYIPGSNIMENGKDAKKSAGVIFVASDAGEQTFTLEPGSYRFKSSL